jgi:hypothetical protein
MIKSVVMDNYVHLPLIPALGKISTWRLHVQVSDVLKLFNDDYKALSPYLQIQPTNTMQITTCIRKLSYTKTTDLIWLRFWIEKVILYCFYDINSILKYPRIVYRYVIFGRGICEKYQSRDEQFPEPNGEGNLVSRLVFFANTPSKYDISV